MNRYAKYLQLRQQYPIFSYDGYDIDIQDDKLLIQYHFNIEGLSCFNPAWEIPLNHFKCNLNDELLHRYVFSLGLVELISYWKLTCSPLVKVNCGSMDDQQIHWFKKLYFHGLGEFFYINEIKVDINSFMDIQPLYHVSLPIAVNKQFKGQLIPFGGGKDSYVSAHILKDVLPNYAYVINHVESAVNAVKVAGYQQRFIHAFRTLDTNMLALNRTGEYLNGHTPFSAMVAFSTVLVSYIYGLENICLSNENSANESTIANDTVNHQYSKTYEFEQDFAWYNQNYLNGNIHYFSFLRPLNELQIAQLFTSFNKYLLTFRSCNVGSKQGIWCGCCAKCCFVAMILAAFNDDATLKEIFGKDMLNDESLIPLYDQLIGLEKDKPFECVGTRKEVQAACILAIQLRNKQTLPLVLQRYISYLHDDKIINEVLHERNNQHNVVNSLLIYLEKVMEENGLWSTN